MGLDDYAGLIQAGQNLVPDVTAELAKTSLMRAQAAEAAQKVSRAQQFQQDIHSFDGTPGSTSRLIMKYPEFADHLKQAYTIQDDEKKQADLLTMGEIYSAANSGNWKLAKQLAHTRADAEKAAGHSDPTYDATLNVLDAAADGDQTQQKVVRNMLGMSIAAITGPDKFTETYGALTKDKGYTLAPGDVRFDENNQKVAGVDAKPDFLVVPEGGRAIPLNSAATAVGTGGGGPASGAAGVPTPASSSGPDEAITHILKHEGGYLAKDGNGYPTNFGINAKANSAELSKLKIADIATMTKPQAIQIYKDKYWPASGAANLPANLQAPYFDVYIRSPAMAKQLLAKSGGDPVTFATTAKETFQNLAQKNPEKYGRFAKAWANRDDDNIAVATGGVSSSASPVAGGAPPGAQPSGIPGTIYGNPKPTAHILTSAEVKAAGLDPAKVYQGHPDGTVSSVGESVGDDSVDGDPNLTGAAYFNTLPKAKQGIVKTIIDGRFPITAKMTSPSVIKLFEDAARVDPTIDASTYQRRVNTQRDFASSGKSGQAITSARTIINHLYNLAQESEKIGGVNWKFGNSVANWVKGQSSDPELQGYMATLTPLSNELPKFLSSKAPTIHEISQTREDFSPDKGPDARRKQIGTTMELMQGRFSPLVEAYSQGMNRNADITDLISSITGDKAAAAKLRALQNYAAGGRLADVGSPQASAPSSAAVQIHSAQEWHALKPGTHYIDPTGVLRVKK